MDSLTDSALTELCKKVKPIIWVLRVSSESKQKTVETYATGFSLSNDGLVMTCAHIFKNLSNYDIDARRLDMEGYSNAASIKFIRFSWDLALLKVEGVSDCDSGKLASDGSLFEGQPILHIGHPNEFVGSFLVGHVSFQCVENVTLPTDRSQLCSTYESNALTITPRYRVMGHIWHSQIFKGRKESFAYEKHLHPLVPIIQCNGLTCRKGCSGGPVFNSQGEIVGMLVSEADGYQIAVHVTLLREFFKISLEETEPSFQVSKGKEPSSSEGASKKAIQGASKKAIQGASKKAIQGASKKAKRNR